MNFRYENKKLFEGYSFIIGCDEVGRGSLAGPVVAAAVILQIPSADDKLKVHKVYKVIQDSKLLTMDQREELAPLIKQSALRWGIGVVDEKIIDEINIHNATLLAMKKAVEGLMGVAQARGLPYGLEQPKGLHYSAKKQKIFLYIDGKFTIPNISFSQEAVVDGDNKILSVAAASIIAKVFRDSLMRQYHQKYPIYNFAQHKGYGTREHLETIGRHGISAIHRKSFCREFVK